VYSNFVNGTRLIETEAGKGEEGEVVAVAFSLPEDMERGIYPFLTSNTCWIV
jgi:hypothetical protein